MPFYGKIQNLCIALLLFGSSAFAQLHDANWILGEQRPAQDTISYGVMVYNMEEVPELVDIHHNHIPFHISNSSFSTADGELLLFSNGSSFFNAQGNVIEGGEDIHPDDNYENGYPFIQGIHFLPDPGNSNSFYAISGDFFQFQNSNGLQLGNDSIFFIRFEYASGIDSFDISITAPRTAIAVDTFTAERMASVRHANGRDWWLILNHYESNRYSKYLLTNGGFQYHGAQEIGLPTIPGLDNGRFSEDGKFYATYSYSGWIGTFTESSIELMEFDRCTGMFSNYKKHHITTDGIGGPGSVCFSPNSKYMYVAAWDSILQFDLYAGDIIGSQITVANYDGFLHANVDSTSLVPTRFFLMQTAADGKIYVSVPNVGSPFLHVIDQPNEKGMSCNVLQHEMQLPYFNYFIIPNFPNYRLSPLLGSSCDTLGPIAAFDFDIDQYNIQFNDLSLNNPTSWQWTFGDGTAVDNQNPSHQYFNSDTYEVCLKVENVYGADSTCQLIPVIGTSTMSLDAAALFTIIPNPVNNIFSIKSDIPIGRIEFYDSNGRKFRSLQTTADIEVNEMASGIYYLKIFFANDEIGWTKLVKI